MEEMVQSPVEAATSVAPTEKLLTQSEVNALIGRARLEGKEVALREAASQAPASSQLSEEKFREIAQQEAMRAQQEQAQKFAVKQLVAQFSSKLEAATEKYPDIKEKVSELDLSTMPEIVHYANSVENTADVMYELANHPEKAVSIAALASMGNTNLAMRQMQKLSNSIKKNQEAAANIKVPSDPLTQISPSNIGGDDGKASLAQLKKMSWARG